LKWFRPGWQVNNNRIRRWWRDEGLRLRRRRKKKRLTGIGVAVGAMSPIRPNASWAMDFQFDTTADGRTLKMLNVIDEFTREAPAIEVGPSTPTGSLRSWIDWPRHEKRRTTCASTTARSSWPTPSTIGAGSPAPVRCSSMPAEPSAVRRRITVLKNLSEYWWILPVLLYFILLAVVMRRGVWQQWERRSIGSLSAYLL
jgi:hypothetical protein